MLALAWPFVALVAIAAAAWLISVRLPAVDENQRLWDALAKERTAREHSHQSMLDNQKRWLEVDAAFGKLVEQVAELRSRVEAAELRKLAGVR